MKFLFIILSLFIISCEWSDEEETINDIGNTIEREGKKAADGVKDTAEGFGEMIERESEPYQD